MSGRWRHVLAACTKPPEAPSPHSRKPGSRPSAEAADAGRTASACRCGTQRPRRPRSSRNGRRPARRALRKAAGAGEIGRDRTRSDEIGRDRTRLDESSGVSLSPQIGILLWQPQGPGLNVLPSRADASTRRREACGFESCGFESCGFESCGFESCLAHCTTTCGWIAAAHSSGRKRPTAVHPPGSVPRGAPQQRFQRCR